MIEDDGVSRMRDALAEAVGDGAFVNKFVIVADVVESDGTRAVHQVSDCDFTYEIFGLMQHGIERARARYHGWDDGSPNHLEGENDDPE